MELNSLYILLPIVLWPLVAVIFAKISRVKGSLLLSFYRQFGIFLIGLPMLFFIPIPLEIILKYWLEILLSTFFGALYVYLTFFGFDYLPIGYSRIFTIISRVFISVGIGFFLLGETLSTLQLLGLGFILLGIISLKPSKINVSHLKSENPNLGILISIVSGISFSISIYYFKLFSIDINPFISAYLLEVGNGLFIGSILLILSFMKNNSLSFKIPIKTFTQILLLSPLILIATYGLAKANETMSFIMINILFVFILLFSILFGWIFLNEKLTKKEILVFVIMIFGLILIKL